MISLSANRVLVTTFGFDEGKILGAMRRIAYDKLVIVTGETSLKKDGYKRLSSIESSTPHGMETVVVDVFDFMDCFNKLNEVILRYSESGDEVILNISGGTKVLADAALLAGFQNGIRTLHCEEELIEMPVILRFRVDERFSDVQKAILRKLESRVEMKKLEAELVKDGYALSSIQKAVRCLTKELSIIEVDVENGRLCLTLKKSHGYFRDALAD